jgi:manganese/zinc/iron transport system substrate-binding protein
MPCRLLIPGLLWMLFAVGCNGTAGSSAANDAARNDSQGAGKSPVRAVATVGMVADIVRNVGGDWVAVTQLMGAGVDPHLYKATRDDVRTIMQADIVFYSGLMLEGKMIDALVKIGRTKPVYAVTELIDEANLLEPEGFAGHYDPHVWMAPGIWSNCIDAVVAALSEYAPQHAADFQANGEVYRQQLEALEAYATRAAATIPDDQRILITSHDAFNYLGRAYGLNVQGVQGISTESEAGLQRINELVDLIVDGKVKAVFVETSVPRKSIEAIVRGAAARDHKVAIGGELFSDAMGAAGTPEGTYVGMVRTNVRTIVGALR